MRQCIKNPVPQTGPCAIDRSLVTKELFQQHKLVQYGSEFRLHGPEIAATISADDALWIIDRLMLGAKSSVIMRRSVIWSQD